VSYFVTGATGFIGRNLVERLLARPRRSESGPDIFLLVRERSRERVDALIAGWDSLGLDASDRIAPIIGDLATERLGVSDDALARLREAGISHFFHLAAVYDITVTDDVNRVANVEGTRYAVALANELSAGIFHHVSSIAVAGEYKGLFREDYFDEGQPLKHAYHQTKFEAERAVRHQTEGAWRVYRPAIVVGDSRTGVMDKIDGPYYFFNLIKLLRHWLPGWFPLVGPELGYTNIVPVDFVVDAIDYIAHQPDLDGQAFHLTNPRSMRSGEVFNAFARVAHAPQMSVRIDTRMLAALPKGTLSMLMQLPAVRNVRRTFLADFGIPEEVLENSRLVPQFDTRDTERALQGSGISVPELDTYAARLWDFWERNLDPDLFRDRSFEGAVNGKTVLITGASQGIGRSAALKIAAAGGIPILVARGRDKLEEVQREIADAGGTSFIYTADLASIESIEELCRQISADLPAVDILVNNAGRSIRRSVALSYDRFHDYERTIQLNYLGTIKLVMGLLPGMRERKSGHVINVSSIGVQTNPPRFSAYVASKAALDAWTRVVGSECIADNVHFTTIHMPLVRTPMIAPTKIYDSFPTISPEEAADLVCEAIRAKPKQINTKLGTFGEVAYTLFPKAVDQILATAYKVFPDSAAAKGEINEQEQASTEQVALAYLMKGVHW
jgi:short-subunit dehydrogenase/thioester reductase-like protein